MLCKQCNNEIGEGNKFCPNCGASVDQLGVVEQPTERTTNSNLVLDNFDYTKFEEAYVGKNYEKLKNKTFSWSSFFFGPAYFIYRKLYTYAIIYILIMIFFPVGFVLGIVFGFLFIKGYFDNVHSKVGQLKLRNQDKTDEELLEICRKKGGTNLIGAIVFEVVCILLLVGSIVLLISAIKNITNGEGGDPIPGLSEIIDEYGYGDDYGEDTGDTVEQQYSYNKEGQIGINTIIKYIVPDDYKRVEDNNEEYMYQSDNTKCEFSASLVKNYNNPEEYIKTILPNSTITDDSISNMFFKKAIDIQEGTKTTKYVTTYNGILYEFSFIDTNDTNNICEVGRDKITGSLELSKLYKEETYSNIKKMDYTEFNNKINNLDTFILVLTKSTCSHCQAYKPVFNKVLSTYNLTAYELDVEMISEEENRDLHSKIYFQSTPTTMFITKGTERDIGTRLIGNVPEEKIIEKLKELNYIESEKNISAEA